MSRGVIMTYPYRERFLSEIRVGSNVGSNVCSDYNIKCAQMLLAFAQCLQELRIRISQLRQFTMC
jgi:hypothetical protein